MNWRKFGSRTLALFMAFCLLFTCAAPARAAETGGTWATVSIPADVGVSSVMNGLGVLPGETPDAYDGIVERCVDYLTEQGRVVAGKIDAWKREQVEGTPWAYGIDVSIIDVIRAWLWDEKVVYNSPTPSGTTWTIGNNTFTSNRAVSFISLSTANSDGTISFSYLWADRSYFYMSASYLTTSKNGNWYTCIYGSDIYSPGLGISLSYYQTKFGTTYCGDFSSFISGTENNFGSVTTDEQVELGIIQSPDFPLAEAYPVWHGNSVAVPPIVGGGSETDDDVVVYPIAPGDTLADTQSKTQEDVWAGAGTITDAPAIPDTVTLADVLSAIVSIPGDIVDGIGKLFFPDVGAFEISLADFFPFCIPYDIFEFFTLLRAEPEAPVFHWEIPVPQLGQTFDIDVDLSAWDEVAELFRTLELLAFIVGLAYVTREKFLRS